MSRTRRWRGATGRRRWAPVIALLLLTAWARPATASDGGARAGDLGILGVDAGDPVRIVFSPPSQLATRTLTTADLDVRIDGEVQQATLRRLSADDLEIAVVVDTSVDADALRALQGAIAEFALELPQGTSIRVIDAEGNADEPAAVPGPAIAAIRRLRPGTGDDIGGAVVRATTLLDGSARGRTALVVIGRDLTGRISPVDDRPLDSLSYLIDIGDGGDASGMLGPRATGRAVTVPTAGDVVGAIDDVSTSLRSLYLAEINGADPAARALTLAVAASEGTTPDTTVALQPDTWRPSLPDPAAGDPAAAQEGEPDAPASRDASTADGQWAWLLGAGLLLAALLAWGLSRTFARGAATAGFPAVPPATPPADQPMSPLRPRRRHPGEKAPRPQRPIAKLAPETREALARAHLGLRQLALASRETCDIVPDDMFRLTEARASAALSGHDRTLGAVLLSMATGDTDDGAAVVHRAYKALLTGWQHTARRRSAPPAVVEINALLRGTIPNGRERPGRPLSPVRALNPLVEIGLEHMVLAAQPDEHAGLVARAVTAVDIMRAARLARPVLTVSPYLLSDAARYRAACAADPADVTERDDWLQFLCDAIARRSQVSVAQINQLRRIRARYRDAAPDLAAARLVDVLLAQPVVEAALIARRLAMPADDAETVAATAERLGWLEPHPGSAGAWVAGDVLDVFSATADVTSSSHQPA